MLTPLIASFVHECLGMPSSVASDVFDATAHYDLVGDTWILTESWEGATNVFKFKLDEECTYEWPGELM